jgi:putative nucleotidyltransferase-like protein
MHESADSKWYRLLRKSQEAKTVLGFETFRKSKIEPILIKGWAAARKYPEHHIRRPGDIDLAVSPEQYEAAWRLVRRPELGKLNIDLHEGLRQLDSLEWADLFDHSVLIDVEGIPVRVLCEEDHLRVLCTHWLIDGGEHRDKLWDIYYAVENRSPDFDWDRCLKIVSANRRRWVICAIALAHKYLQLDISDLPFKSELQIIPKWITRCIEREWARPGRLEPVLTSTHDKGLLLRQIARRMPPNPIRATIEANGDLYGRQRFIYQTQVIGRRALPFARDVITVAKRKLRGAND